MLILLTSCKNGTSVDPFENSDDVGNYLQELPSWNQFSPPGQVRPPTPAGEAQIEDDVVLECGSH
ncbi:MAG: hypothetical protein EA364_12350 [Balneolaceae bacterium]|nr:MAG: hypothetical protein EA364_12350 [Balneolaceae bacterium]